MHDRWLSKTLNEADPRAMWFVTETWGAAFSEFKVEAHWVEFELGWIPQLFSAKCTYCVSRAQLMDRLCNEQFALKILRDFDYVHAERKRESMDKLEIVISPFLAAKIAARQKEVGLDDAR